MRRKQGLHACCKQCIRISRKHALVKLNRLPESGGADVYLKLEYQNPSGSVKDRAALNMIKTAEEQGLIHKDTVIIEPTSGNTGIGLR